MNISFILNTESNPSGAATILPSNRPPARRMQGIDSGKRSRYRNESRLVESSFEIVQYCRYVDMSDADTVTARSYEPEPDWDVAGWMVLRGELVPSFGLVLAY